MEEALNMLKMVIDIHQRGGFMMSNWMSNSQKLLKELLGEYILRIYIMQKEKYKFALQKF